MPDDRNLAAASYVLGLSRGEERKAFEAEARSDLALGTRVELWQNSFVVLDLASGREMPPADLFPDILAAIDHSENGLPGTSTLRAGTGAWTELAPGVSCLVLHDNLVSNRRSMLIRAVPGSILAAHLHPNGDEECLVLEGDLAFGDCILRAGDFQVARAGSAHPAATTRSGCLLHVSTAF